MLFRIRAEPVDCFAQTFKSSFFSLDIPVVVDIRSPYLSGRADGFFSDEIEEVTVILA